MPNANYIVKEWHTISQAPVIFTTAILLVCAGMWAFMRLLHGREINGLKQEVSVLKSTCDHYKALAEGRRPDQEQGFLTDEQREKLTVSLRSHSEKLQGERLGVDL